MAGLKAALEAEQGALKGPPCGVATLLAEIDAEDAEVLRAALSDKGKQATMISRALRSVGHEVGDHTLQRHRRGDCTCDRRES